MVMHADAAAFTDAVDQHVAGYNVNGDASWPDQDAYAASLSEMFRHLGTSLITLARNIAGSPAGDRYSEMLAQIGEDLKTMVADGASDATGAFNQDTEHDRMRHEEPRRNEAAFDVSRADAAGRTGGTPSTGRSTYNPDQPRAADGKWTTVGDTLHMADGDTCHGTDQVKGAGPVDATIALMDYTGDGGGRYVAVATPPGRSRWNPVTSKHGPPEDDPYSRGSTYAAPLLDPGEAETAAGHLEDLAALAESGYRPPKPTRHSRARQQLRHLIEENRAGAEDRIAVGTGDDKLPLTNADLLDLLALVDPVATPTRRKVVADAICRDGGDGGTVWIDLEPDGDGRTHVVVTAVEDVESPDTEYNRQYAGRFTPDAARDLAAKLRTFAGAARRTRR